MPKYLLLDGNSLVYRVFFALPTDMATASGQVTNAVFGFTSMLINLLKDHKPDGIAVAFDLPQPTFRHELVDDLDKQDGATRPAGAWACAPLPTPGSRWLMPTCGSRPRGNPTASATAASPAAPPIRNGAASPTRRPATGSRSRHCSSPNWQTRRCSAASTAKPARPGWTFSRRAGGPATGRGQRRPSAQRPAPRVRNPDAGSAGRRRRRSPGRIRPAEPATASSREAPTSA